MAPGAVEPAKRVPVMGETGGKQPTEEEECHLTHGHNNLQRTLNKKNKKSYSNQCGYDGRHSHRTSQGNQLLRALCAFRFCCKKKNKVEEQTTNSTRGNLCSGQLNVCSVAHS